MRNIVSLPDFTGSFVSGGRCSLDVPIGRVYNDVTFEFYTAAVAMTVAQMLAQVSSITLKLNGKPVREWTPGSLGIVNGTDGAQFATANGYLRDYFALPALRTIEGEERNALGTDGLRTMTYEIVWLVAVTPTVKAWANVEEFNRPVLAYPFRHIRTYNSMPVVAASAQFPGSSLNKQANLWYRRIHFSSVLISKAKMLVNGVTKWDDLPRLLVTELLAKQGLAQQANVYTMAFDGTSSQYTDILPSFGVNDKGEKLPVADLRLEYTGTAGGSVDIITEQLNFVSLD